MRRKLDDLDKDFVLKNRNNFTPKQISKKLNLSEAAIIKYLEENPVQVESSQKEESKTKKNNGTYILDETKSNRGDLYTKSVATNWPDRIHKMK